MIEYQCKLIKTPETPRPENSRLSRLLVAAKPPGTLALELAQALLAFILEVLRVLLGRVDELLVLGLAGPAAREVRVCTDEDEGDAADGGPAQFGYLSSMGRER